MRTQSTIVSDLQRGGADDGAAAAPTSVHELLARAAARTVEQDVALDDFMRSAWHAFMDARPGMREAFEEQTLAAQLAEMRARGGVGQA